jgi:hypothetical protein
MTSTKITRFFQGYAQNLCRAVQKSRWRRPSGRAGSGIRKCLIYKETLNCLFTGQSKETLDLQGFPGFDHKLSTKLSTGNLDNFETLKKQAIHAPFQAARLSERAL